MYLDIIFNVLGGLGIFLYGMDSMSSGMQKLAGQRLKKILALLTTNRVVAILMGIGVTMLVQSSSVSTVMTIGFVNASLLTLKQALGVIFGANIGTTVTGWILVLNIGKYGLPIVGAGAILYIFLKGDRAKTKALTFMGLGMIFLGLQLMSNGLKPVRSMPEFVSMFHMFSADTYFGVIKVAAVGALITAIVQSSSATLGITITLAVQGLIDYPTAVALVLGENVGTTITAILATLNANVNAKRAAYAHTIINTLGVIWVTAVFPYYLKFLSNFGSPEANITMAIATAHTMFNVTNVLLFTPFIGVMADLLNKIVKDDGKKDERVTKIDFLMLKTPSVVVGQTKTEILTMGKYIEEMFSTLDNIYANNEFITPERVAQMRKIEDDLDLFQKEITDANFVILNKNITDKMKMDTRNNLEVCDEYETISDYLMRVTNSLKKLQDNSISLTEDEKTTLKEFNEETRELFRNVNTAYALKNREMFMKGIIKANRITEKYREAKHIHLKDGGQENPIAMLTTSYMDILNHYRRVRDHIFNIIEVYNI
ncbi:MULTISPECIES: Na/Pi cotransporter family protein [Fusobacterium]|jgi:phosphate:Na+ symporter|uniref:Na/Pi cotransporter family protein n=1 Tax=Fusobacterium varium ATCC 27725 TaxID=469618 RepID=A0ABN5JH31_FUSVA|nr:MULTISPECIES: Na/Pi cotransporter family protein [Fusobacterium]AVQ31375.1 Na/Pi cotransporter family protein [Fusobacterium varium ATCC 27725]EES62701.1 Na/Pi-cotransporter II-like protein [Fusobacterium varium ATCC 27725]MDY4006769.1 Na/Pi cotransporter family protein [Fusobacterium varium]OFL86490.1 phosphate transporter [Fusobacterium sp. HMSC073F01]RGJ28727.1 Na/Pi cotransporter family protein [Fusobacterium varium]